MSDAEDSFASLQVSWSVDGAVAADPVRGNVNGEAITTVNLQPGQRLIGAVVLDSGGLTATAEMTATVRPPNQLPTCGITEPDDGVGLPLDAPALLRGFATDPDDALDTLAIAWTSDVDGVLGTAPPDAIGELREIVGVLTPGQHQIQLTVDDGYDGLCHDEHTLFVSERPTATISAPFGGAIFEDDDAILLAGTATDAEDPSASLVVDWSSDLDEALGTSSPDASGYAEFVVPSLSAGSHTLRMQVTDATGVGGSDQVEIEVIPAAR